MVWKRLIIFGCIFAVILALPITANAAEVYTEGNISTTYVTYFRDILSKESLLDDYVFFRSGQYEYTMVVGDLEFINGSIVSYGNSKLYTIYTTSAGYNTYYQFSSATVSNYSVSVNSALVYSNLGSFPDLMQRSDYIETGIVLILIVIICMSLLSRIFNFSLRTRRS